MVHTNKPKVASCDKSNRIYARDCTTPSENNKLIISPVNDTDIPTYEAMRSRHKPALQGNSLLIPEDINSSEPNLSLCEN